MLICFIDGVAKDRVVGFEDFGGSFFIIFILFMNVLLELG